MRRQRATANLPSPPSADAPLIEWALWNAEVGRVTGAWRVFPCVPGAKHPLHEGWQDEASSDAKTVACMWANDPRANIGLAIQPGFVAIDGDPYKPGAEAAPGAPPGGLRGRPRVPVTRSNAVLVCHARTGDRHVASRLRQPRRSETTSGRALDRLGRSRDGGIANRVDPPLQRNAKHTGGQAVDRSRGASGMAWPQTSHVAFFGERHSPFRLATLEMCVSRARI